MMHVLLQTKPPRAILIATALSLAVVLLLSVITISLRLFPTIGPCPDPATREWDTEACFYEIAQVVPVAATSALAVLVVWLAVRRSLAREEEPRPSQHR